MINNLNELKRNEKLAIRKVGDQFYLVCGRDCYEVNDIGAVIVNAIGKDMPISVLCEKLSIKYDFSDLEKIRQDVYSFIDFLVSEDLLKSD
jgi:hypothetical protein